MKKRITAIIAAIIMLMVLSALVYADVPGDAQAAFDVLADTTVEYMVLNNSEKTVSVTGAQDGLTSITIPGSVSYNGETYTVAEIAKNAFRGYESL